MQNTLVMSVMATRLKKKKELPEEIKEDAEIDP